MPRTIPALGLLVAMSLVSACESQTGTAVLGGVGGAAVGAGGYEFHLKRQRDRVEADYKAGRIDQREYNIRVDQIARDSLLQ